MSNDDFPKRSVQHVSEDMSIRVFQECLPATWIFRDQGTRNDYGIDAEVELVGKDGQLHGDIAKVQLKGQAAIDFNDDGVAAVGGIKQSTLRYWLSLSRYANVIIAVTDNTTREAYIAPVFWEATERLDGSQETRSIHFQRTMNLRTTAGRREFILATIEQPWALIRTHEELLRGLARTLHDCLWVFQADPWGVQDRSETVQRWLRLCQQLLGHRLLEGNNAALFDFDHWRAKSEKQWNDSPAYGTLRSTYLDTFAIAFPEMSRISSLVLKGSYFWKREAPEYFALVERTVLPKQFEYDDIESFVTENRIEDPRW